MKIGIRTPSPTKSIKARTTGRIKRAAKRSINPFYGRKGMGYFKDPKRAIKNKVYHKFTADPLDKMKDKAKKANSPLKAAIIPMVLFYIIAIISGSYTEFIFLYSKQFSIIGTLITIFGFVLFVLFYRSRYS